MADTSNNYVLGRGRVYVDLLDANKQSVGGEKYMGNCPEFNTSTSSDTLDHYASTGGLRVKDASVTLQVNRSGGFTCDNIAKDNLALFFTGVAATQAQTSGTALTNDIKLQRDAYFQLGRSLSNPSGHRKVSNVSVKLKAAPQTVVPASEYEVDLDLGRIYIKPNATITNGTEYTVTYDAAAASREQIISKNTPIYAAVRFVADNAVGTNRDYYLPYVKLAPDGDYNLIADEFQVMGFTMEILKLNDSTEAIYIDGRAA